MRFNVRVHELPRGRTWFGGRKPLPTPTPLKLFAFVVLPTGQTSVMEYEDTPDGCEDLASLLRTGDVVTVVRGEALNFSVESVVSVGRPMGAYESRLPLNRSF